MRLISESQTGILSYQLLSFYAVAISCYTRRIRECANDHSARVHFIPSCHDPSGFAPYLGYPVNIAAAGLGGKARNIVRPDDNDRYRGYRGLIYPILVVVGFVFGVRYPTLGSWCGQFPECQTVVS